VTGFHPEHSTRSGSARSLDARAIVDALRRYGTDSARLGHSFASLHQLQPADLQALVAIMTAEQDGEPLTPGQLSRHLGLSSGGTSYVIDRLAAAGQVRRSRDHPSDNRVVHLHHTDQGSAAAMAFFGPLAQAVDAVLDQFDDAQLETVRRFITGTAQAMHDHLAGPEQPDRDG
jgi:DNA-binding MarR family transcriptional regulator